MAFNNARVVEATRKIVERVEALWRQSTDLVPLDQHPDSKEKVTFQTSLYKEIQLQRNHVEAELRPNRDIESENARFM